MRAAQVLQRCLSDALVSMHASRRDVLFNATEALLQGRRLTLMDVARSWPDAQRVRAPLKALDRLLSNRHLQGERLSLHAAMAVWLLRQPQPVIVVDWCDLKADRSQHLLRAVIAVGGRTLTLLDAVFPDGMQASPVAEKQFLEQLAKLIPAECTPIIVTDAGFRAPWFRGVEALGWHWLGRLRNRTLIKPVDEEQPEDSLTRKGSRIEILLLIHTLAAFASWLVGIACERVGIDRWLNPRRSIKRLYSVMRLGREALVRRWLDWTIEQLLAQLLDPHQAWREQLELPA